MFYLCNAHLTKSKYIFTQCRSTESQFNYSDPSGAFKRASPVVFSESIADDLSKTVLSDIKHLKLKLGGSPWRLRQSLL